MKTYTDKLVVNMNAEIAWEALKMMDKWLPNLSTNQAIHFEGGEDFFYEGRKYDIVTKEGIKMSCEISEVNEEAFWIEIHARHSLAFDFKLSSDSFDFFDLPIGKNTILSRLCWIFI